MSHAIAVVSRNVTAYTESHGLIKIADDREYHIAAKKFAGNCGFEIYEVVSVSV